MSQVTASGQDVADDSAVIQHFFDTNFSCFCRAAFNGVHLLADWVSLQSGADLSLPFSAPPTPSISLPVVFDFVANFPSSPTLHPLLPETLLHTVCRFLFYTEITACLLLDMLRMLHGQQLNDSMCVGCVLSSGAALVPRLLAVNIPASESGKSSVLYRCIIKANAAVAMNLK